MYITIDQPRLDCVFIKGKAEKKNWSFLSLFGVVLQCVADRATAAVLQICLSGKAMGVTLLVLANTQMLLNILAVFCWAEHICDNSML